MTGLFGLPSESVYYPCTPLHSGGRLLCKRHRKVPFAHSTDETQQSTKVAEITNEVFDLLMKQYAIPISQSYNV